MASSVSYNQLLKAKNKFIKAKDYTNAFYCLHNLYDLDQKRAYKEIISYRELLTGLVKNGVDQEENMKLLKNAYIITAKEIFDDYCIALEWNREASKKFYLPRRKQLLTMVKELQRLEDDELDLLCISCPPGVGKTTLAIFYLTWLAGRSPNSPNLGGSHNNSFLSGVYNECLRIIKSDDEYIWNDIFRNVKLVSTNAKDMRLDVGVQKRFETLQFTSIGSGNAGKVRAAHLLYCDDLIDGIETAMSKDRLDKLWQQYYTDLRQRKIGNCKELHIATRWSVHDVIGRLESQFGENPRCKFIALAALNEKDESNFDYPFGLGFSTEFYREQRRIMDEPSWKALYMNIPIEREGLLYDRKELRRFFILPDQEPDAILSVCDTKSTGSDYCVMPIAYKYGDDYYIVDILCDNSNPEIVEGKLIAKILEHKVQMSRFESNVEGRRIAQKVQEQVRAQNGRCSITTKYTTQNKETKIIIHSPFIKQHFLFLDDSMIKDKHEYRKALDFLCGYTLAGKNKYDDVPDAFAQFSDFIQNSVDNKVQLVKRLF